MDQRGRVCDKCGYDLTGIKGLHGTCPECGNAWDLMSGRGLGGGEKSRRQKADKLLARIRTIGLAVFSLFVLVCGSLGALVAQNTGGNPLRPLAIAGLVAAIGFMAALTSYFHEDE